MNNIIKSQVGLIRELLDSTNDIGIILSENQNIDSVGAALGLYLVLQASGKNIQIVSKKVPEVLVSNLFGVDKIKQQFGGVSKMITISIPYHEEIEKVSYNIEGDRLNVNLFAEEQGINLDEKQIEYIRKGSNPTVIITVGVADERELVSFVDPASIRLINIDTNSSNALTGEVTLVDPQFSSLSEIAAEIIRELNLGFDQDGFTNLMQGIEFATSGLTSPSTSGYAFGAVGYLIQNGAKRSEVSPAEGSFQSGSRTNEIRRENQRLDDTRQMQDQRQNQGGRRDDRGQVRDDRNRDRGRDNRQNRDQNQRRDQGDDRQADRNRNFPNESHFLNQRPPRNPQNQPRNDRGQNQNQNQNQNTSSNMQPRYDDNQTFGQQVTQNQSQPQPAVFDQVETSDLVEDSFASAQPQPQIVADPDLNQAPKPYYDPRANSQPISGEAHDVDMPSEYVDSNSTEGNMPAEIPDDWFLPKVFKGSKKTNN